MVARMIAGTLVLLLAGCSGGGGTDVEDQAPVSTGIPGTVQLKVTALSVAENAATVDITIARVNGSAGPMDVTVSTAPGSAIAGQDFTATSTSVQFANGDTTDKVVAIPVLNDTTPETSESFTVSIASLGNLFPAPATVIILDDDSPGTVQLSRAAYSVGEGGASVEIGVSRLDGEAGPAHVTLTTRDSAAFAGQDYTATTTTITFADGDAATKTVTIPILDDAAAESDEAFEVVLSGAVGAALGTPATATITIPSNDQPAPPPAGGLPGSLQLSAATYTVSESSGNVIVTVSRIGGTSGTVGATLTITPDSVLAGSDYVGTSTPVSFASGDGTSHVIAIPIVNDAVAESSESFSVVLAAATGGATLGTPTAATIAIQDNDPPNAPVLSLSPATKRLDLGWPAVPTALIYKVFLNPDGASGFTQAGADIAAPASSGSIDISAHAFNWAGALLRVEACNETACSGSASVSALSAMLPVIGYFKAASVDANDRLGTSVAVSGDGQTIAIGVPGEDSNATGVDGNAANNSASASGAVYVFARAAGAWSQQAYLKASNSIANAEFGAAVVISSDASTIAVGAPGRNTNAGAAYVFVRSGASWVQQSALVASNAESGDRFGVALALTASGTALVVGATGEDSNGAPANNAALDAGAAYVFTRSGAVWSQQAYLKASNVEAGDRFGGALALDANGSTLAVAASAEASAAITINGNEADNTAPGAGAVYVFIGNGATWTQTAYVKAPNAEAGDSFGGAVSLSADGNTLAIGAPFEDGTEIGALAFPIPPPPGPPPTTLQGLCDVPVLRPSVGCESGAVYVFVRSAGAWSAQSYIKGSNNEIDDRVGTSVALAADGASVAIGSPSEDSSALGLEGNETLEDASASGAAYVYTRSGSTWSQQAYVKAPNTDANDAFGVAVSLSADAATLIIGATGEASNSANDRNNNTAGAAGAAYLY